MTWSSKVIIHALMIFSSFACARKQVNQVVASQVDHEGKIYAKEMRAQSPFKEVELTWQEAYELMKVRNLDYRKAVLGISEAKAQHSLVGNFSNQMGSSLGNAVRGVINPEEMIQTLKDPVTSLPKQFESVTSLKNVSHDMQEKEWGKKEKAIASEAKRREEIVRLQVLFRRGKLIDQHLGWSEKMSAREELDPAVKPELEKYAAKLKDDRKKWLNEVRDFFNAEYYDVKLAGGEGAMPDYQKTAQPDFSDWKRWGVLTRQTSLAKVLKAQHKEQKPMIPGANLVADKIDLMLNGESPPLAEIEQEDVRNHARLMIRSWREMKQAQNQADKLKAELDKMEAEASLAKVLVDKKTQLYALRNSEISSAKVVWMMDETCWRE